MSALVTAALCVAAWLVCAIPTYRIVYVQTYENGKEESPHRKHRHLHNESVSYGLLAAVAAPVTVWAALIVRYGTPTPPSRAAELAEKAIELEQVNAARIERMERELGIA